MCVFACVDREPVFCQVDRELNSPSEPIHKVSVGMRVHALRV